MKIIPSRSLLSISFPCFFSLNFIFRNVENIAENKDNFGGRTSDEIVSSRNQGMPLIFPKITLLSKAKLVGYRISIVLVKFRMNELITVLV